MKRHEVSPLVLQKVLWLPVRIILITFGRMEIHGLENLKSIRSNVIFAANHSSELDPILLPAALPFWSRFSPMYYAHREISFYNRRGFRRVIYRHMFFKLWGGHQIKTGCKDYRASLANHLKLLQEGKSLFFFPEGDKTRDGARLPTRGGIGYLLQHGNRPVVPVAITGTFQTTASQCFTRKRKIIMSIGHPIYPSDALAAVAADAGKCANIYKAQAEYVMTAVEHLLNKITNGSVDAAPESLASSSEVV
jgi:1-acyl-sn-glycerol-3-phosphate acyltransferase